MSNGFENNRMNVCSINSSKFCSLNNYTCVSLAVALFDALSNAIYLLATLCAKTQKFSNPVKIIFYIYPRVKLI